MSFMIQTLGQWIHGLSNFLLYKISGVFNQLINYEKNKLFSEFQLLACGCRYYCAFLGWDPKHHLDLPMIERPSLGLVL